MSTESSSKSGSSNFTEDEQHVAGNAHNFFKAGQYDAAIGTLKKIQKLHSSDPRLMHNRALTEFCKSHQTKVTDFRKNLFKIHKLVQQTHKEDEDFVGSAEKNNFMALHYNQALLHFNMHQYSECEDILEGLYENCEVSEDSFFLKTCLLLVDAHLAMYNASKAGTLISVIENVFLISEETNTNQKTGNNEDKYKCTAILSLNEVESLRCYLRYLKARCHLQQKSIKACKREIKSLAPGVGGNSSSSSLSQSSIAQIASVFLKSNFEFVRCNYHKAYKLLASCPPTIGSSANSQSNSFNDSVPAMYYNNLAVIHFHMSKYNLATFYMQKALHENEKYFSEAFKQHQQQNSSGRHQQQSSLKPLSLMHCNKRYELLYNCGLQLLHAGKSSSAFDCLVAAVPAYHSNPRLWLRLAECCVQKCTSQNADQDVSARSTKKSSQSHVQTSSLFTLVGGGSHRKVVVNNIHALKGGKSNNVAMPGPTLEFASLCLNNALSILQLAIDRSKEVVNTEQNSENGVKADGTKESPPLVLCHPGPHVSGDQLMNLYASVLANSAFVALQLGNGLQALIFSQTLLDLPKSSACHRYLGRTYAAEALVKLDRISEAIQLLSAEKVASVSCNLNDNGKKSPTSDEGKSGADNSDANLHHHKSLQSRLEAISPWHFPPTAACAQAYMLLNLATSHCLRSEFEKAQRLLRHATGALPPRQAPPQAILLAVYLSLHANNGASSAIQHLRRNTLTLPRPSAPNNHHNQQPQQNNASAGPRPFASVVAVNSSANHGGTDSSASSTSSNGAGRSKAGTPQPVAGGITPERVVKGKSESKSKRNRR